MSKFDEYWDTRIEANKKLFDGNPTLANLLYDEAMLAYEKAEGVIATLCAENERFKYNLEVMAKAVRANSLKNERLKTAIENCIEYANNRESEWGERAEAAFKFLYDVIEE